MTVDLHLHTTASDGSFTPEEVVNKASELGLQVIAITDHDTINGIEEAKLAALDKDLEIISGIELNTDLPDAEVHILGYYIDYKDIKFKNVLKELRNARYNRIKIMIKRLRNVGILINFNRVCEIAGKGALGRVHLAKAMIESGYVQKVSQAFEEYIGKGCPAYKKRYKLTPIEAIKLIKSVGGIPVLAHPALAKKDSLIPKLVEFGLEGIEVYHSEHDKYNEQYYSALAEEYELIKTGGSDCHGLNKVRTLIGTVEVPKKAIKELQRKHGLALV
ncbi:PHP domain-containing protein [Selenihalanaerobacter shriftii]|uniref:Polymerase/histidinol phosphatase N-terminal domain-containing protein n=1 Tax=Selenihalanaerobacter shriftii TaxID=142842 RepID=A0A1T4JLV5_9FIRM|nr:PHP domain-containing protein [Selenihalanaerobacter shriftii]SJZ31149.1 hypothetical protein SAMN02745118_00171 [Selenihalanaerobacter shriftii]